MPTRRESCACARDYEVVIARESEYSRLKTLLNRGRHPTFVGRDMVERNARNGGALVFRFGGEDVGVAVLNARLNVLLVMNVAPAHRSHGLGAAMLHYCRPTWVRAVESAAGYFRERGYVDIGAPKQGRALLTQIMVRGNLLTLAGRVSKLLTTRSESALAQARDQVPASVASDATRPARRTPRVVRRPRRDELARFDPQSAPQRGDVR